MFSSVNPADDYPPHLKHLAPTDADLDMVGEEVSGKPVDKSTAITNAQAMEERIAQLEAERVRLISNKAKHDLETFEKHLTSYETDLTTARERLDHYRSQIGKQN